MVSKTMVGAAAIVFTAGIGGMASAAALPLPATGSDGGQQPVADHDLTLRLRDAGQHAGERFPVYGLVYSDAAVWTLAFVNGGPTDFYTIDGSRVELTPPSVGALAQGDVFSGTITITGKQDSGDPVVTLDNFSVIGHRSTDALR